MAALPTLRARTGPGRRRRAAALALAALAVLYLSVLAVASTDRVERALHDRLHGALQARLGPVRLGDEVELDPLLRVSFGPLELAPAGEGPPVVRAAHVLVRPDLTALLRGRLVPASILLGDVRIRPGPGGGDLRALVDRLRGRRAAVAPASGEAPGAERDLPKVKLRGLVIELPLRGEGVEVGPLDADLRVTRGAEGAQVQANLSLRRGGRLRLDAALAGGAWRATLRGEELGPQAIPPALRSRAAAVTAARATLEVEADAPADLSRATAELRATVDEVVLAGERIGAEPVGPLRATAEARVTWDARARTVVLSDAAATLLRAASGTASGELRLGPPATFTLSLRADPVDWGAIVAALPPAVAVPPQAPRPGGALSARLDVSGPLLEPDAWTVSAGLELGALREAARRAGRSQLAGPFVHRPPLDGGGRGPELRVGLASPDFVPIGELPEHVVRAVTSAEDGGFFGHPGFDFDELRNAIAAGARRGRLVRGGSTITQQVAKNLFLGPERTFARKVREAAITVGLEATLPKRRILEIYLNVAEWGPGIWGIGPAARHWFGKDARALTPKEAALLAAVIPSPVRYRAQLFARGGLDEGWEARVRDLLFTMNQQGSLDDASLAEALAQPLALGPPAGAATPAAATPAAATAPPDPAAATPAAAPAPRAE